LNYQTGFTKKHTIYRLAMNSTLIKKISAFGITPGIAETDANRIKLVNLLALIPFPLYIFTTAYCLVFDYLRIVYANAIPLIAIPVILFLNSKLRYTMAKVVFICSNTLVVLIYYKLMDDEKSMFFYFFPLILCLLLFYDPKNEIKALLFTAAFTGIIIFLTLFLPAAIFNPAPLTLQLHRFINIFNSLSCVLIMILYAYYIFKVNLQKETQLIKAKELAETASRAKAQFLSNMSHELRTPLNGIVGTANILKMEDASPELKQHFSVMTHLSEHMLGLVNDILDFSKIESGKLELHQHPFSLYLLIKRLNGFFIYQFRSKKITLVFDTDIALKDVYVNSDDLRLQQILTNLIGNALKFTHKGKVTVKTSLLHKTASMATVQFNIMDDGIGIDAEKIKTIFESFNQGDAGTTRKYGGTGLGLSICSSLVKLFGGQLQVKSEKDKGSDFYFTIDLAVTEKPAAPLHKPVSLNSDHLRNKKILIAEDNPINMNVARTILQKWGVEVHEAVNGKIAVEKCTRINYDLVLIDLEMPEMNGSTAIQEINKLPHKTPAIAFTAGVYENMAEDLVRKGFFGHVHKPFKPEELLLKISEAVLHD
jgi:signal transduction histidine kinase/CheY-like chemotaxis protein